VAIFAKKMMNGVQPLINGSGDQERDFVYVSDIANASVLALDRAGGEVLNIGSGVGTSVNRIFGLLQELQGIRIPAKYGPEKKGEVYRIFLNPEKAADRLGWKPELTLQEGLRQTLEFFKSPN
jgi:UDP-glucose 4-epimerase